MTLACCRQPSRGCEWHVTKACCCTLRMRADPLPHAQSAVWISLLTQAWCVHVEPSGETCADHSPWPGLREALQQQRRWREGLDAMPRSAEVGCLHVESDTLHAALLPLTQQAAERLGAQLLATARTACAEALAALTAATKAALAAPAAQQVLARACMQSLMPLLCHAWL